MSLVTLVRAAKHRVKSGETFDLTIEYETETAGEHASLWAEPSDFFRTTPAEVSLTKEPNGGKKTVRVTVVRRVVPGKPKPRECRIVASVNFIKESDFVEVA